MMVAPNPVLQSIHPDPLSPSSISLLDPDMNADPPMESDLESDDSDFAIEDLEDFEDKCDFDD